MIQGVFKSLAGVLSFEVVLSPIFSHAQCSTNTVIVSGRIDHPPRKGLVRVQLIYPKQKQQLGESAEATVDGESFRIQIPFLTQSRTSILNLVPDKCDRKPTTIIVTLLKPAEESGDEYDRVSLDFAKDFKMADASAYALRSEITLHGPPSSSAIR